MAKALTGPGQPIFDKAIKYAEKDAKAAKACDKKKDKDDCNKCHKEALTASKENRKKLKKLAKSEYKRYVKHVKSMKDVSEKERGKMIWHGGHYYDAWTEFAETGKGKMKAVWDLTGAGAVYPNYPTVKWPLYGK